MRPVASEFATPEVRKAAQHLSKLVRQARLARRMPQTELAARARTTQATVHKIEHGGVQSALGTWLALMEQVGLLKLILEMKDPISEALQEEHNARRAKRNVKPDLDF
jgi:ribosome-binding protein aMBF1 (putative translation factor)